MLRYCWVNKYTQRREKKKCQAYVSSDFCHSHNLTTELSSYWGHRQISHSNLLTACKTFQDTFARKCMPCRKYSNCKRTLMRQKPAEMKIANMNNLFSCCSCQMVTQQILWIAFCKRRHLITWKASKSLAYQIKSLQWQQYVGCLSQTAINLCPLIWCTRRRIAPLRPLIPLSLSLKTLFSLSARKQRTHLHWSSLVKGTFLTFTTGLSLDSARFPICHNLSILCCK